MKNFIEKIQRFIKTIGFKINKNEAQPWTIADIEATKFIVLDTETTGFDYLKDCILCIGAIPLQNNTIALKDSFEVYIDQDQYDQNSAKIHGILKQWILERPTELEALQQFVSYLGNHIIIAHHAYFDVGMINKALERNGLPRLKNKTLDTATLYKETLLKSNLLEKKESYSLDELADKFDISKKDRHTAIGDAYITAIAFLKIIHKLKFNKDFNLNDYLKQYQ